MLERFLKTWEEREKSRAQYSSEARNSSFDGKDPGAVALALSRRLITVVKAKNILNIEAGMEMIALAMAISSEVRYDFFLFLNRTNLPFKRIMGCFRKWLQMSKSY